MFKILIRGGGQFFKIHFISKFIQEKKFKSVSYKKWVVGLGLTSVPLPIPTECYKMHIYYITNRSVLFCFISISFRTLHVPRISLTSSIYCLINSYIVSYIYIGQSKLKKLVPNPSCKLLQ